jgi:hypothetical protein
LYAAIQGYHSADGEEIRKARSEIRTISRELFDYIDKEIGYIPFEEVYELGFILGLLPVTPKQLLERNGTMVYKEIQDTTKPYVILIDIMGRQIPHKLSEVAASKLYSKPHEPGQKIYKVNLAYLIQMSAKKKVPKKKLPKKKEPLEVERESGIKQDNEEEKVGGEPDKKVFIERDKTVKKGKWYKDFENKLSKHDEKLRKLAKKQKSHGYQLKYRLQRTNNLEKKLSKQKEEINDLKNNTANLDNKVDDFKEDFDKFQNTFTKWVENTQEMLRVLSIFGEKKSALKGASKSPGLRQSLWSK